MEVFVNNESVTTLPDIVVSGLLSTMNINGERGVALAVNNEVIPKTEWDTFKLQPQDKVTLIKATQGG